MSIQLPLFNLWIFPIFQIWCYDEMVNQAIDSHKEVKYKYASKENKTKTLSNLWLCPIYSFPSSRDPFSFWKIIIQSTIKLLFWPGWYLNEKITSNNPQVIPCYSSLFFTLSISQKKAGFTIKGNRALKISSIAQITWVLVSTFNNSLVHT